MSYVFINYRKVNNFTDIFYMFNKFLIKQLYNRNFCIKNIQCLTSSIIYKYIIFQIYISLSFPIINNKIYSYKLIPLLSALYN